MQALRNPDNSQRGQAATKNTSTTDFTDFTDKKNPFPIREIREIRCKKPFRSGVNPTYCSAIVAKRKKRFSS
jgi:hypothetical protein